MIEVLHNELNLTARRRVFVRNVRRADQTIRKMMDMKRSRGMKLRYIPDYPGKSYYLEARCLEPVIHALRELRNTGNILSITPYYTPLAN